MSRKFWSIAVLAAVTVVGNSEPAGAQTFATGPYYATPAWSQKLACETPTNCPRFVVLTNWSNEAVLDRETGLVWQRTPHALAASQRLQDLTCSGSSVGARYGWRLPTMAELMSLGDPSNGSADFHLAPGHPFILNVLEGTAFWSADRRDDLQRAAVAEFRPQFLLGGYAPGLGIIDSNLGSPYRAWCVRGLQ